MRVQTACSVQSGLDLRRLKKLLVLANGVESVKRKTLWRLTKGTMTTSNLLWIRTGQGIHHSTIFTVKALNLIGYADSVDQDQTAKNQDLS